MKKKNEIYLFQTLDEPSHTSKKLRNNVTKLTHLIELRLCNTIQSSDKNEKKNQGC